LKKKYRIRFNKSKGSPGRGTCDHAWRVLSDDGELLAKDVFIKVNSQSEQEGPDWNIVCWGTLLLIDETDTVVIV